MPDLTQARGQASRTSVLSRLSLAARLYAIFALFALLTAAMTMLSDNNSRRAIELTEAIETANTGALNVERVNSLVYAPVMRIGMPLVRTMKFIFGCATRYLRMGSSRVFR